MDGAVRMDMIAINLNCSGF